MVLLVAKVGLCEKTRGSFGCCCDGVRKKLKPRLCLHFPVGARLTVNPMRYHVSVTGLLSHGDEPSRIT